MTIKEWLHTSSYALTDNGIDSARLDCLLLLEYVLTMDRAHILAHDHDELTIKQKDLLDSLLHKRADLYPIAYLTARKDFHGLEFYVNENVLIPRPETEFLVEKIIAAAPTNASMIDVGTGSGAIAISVKSARKDVTVIATDVSQAALEVAQKNALAQNVEIIFRQSDLLTNVAETFDVIAANLPYVPYTMADKKDIKHEPKISLFSGDSGLDLYTQFIPQLTTHLSENGFVIIEHLPSQVQALTELAHAHDMHLEIVTDYVSRLSSKSDRSRVN